MNPLFAEPALLRLRLLSTEFNSNRGRSRGRRHLRFAPRNKPFGQDWSRDLVRFAKSRSQVFSVQFPSSSRAIELESLIDLLAELSSAAAKWRIDVPLHPVPSPVIQRFWTSAIAPEIGLNWLVVEFVDEEGQFGRARQRALGNVPSGRGCVCR